MNETDDPEPRPDDSSADPDADRASTPAASILRALQSRSEAGTRDAVLFGSGRDLSLRQVAQYEVGEELARGGIGVILRGRDLDLGREVALKVLRPECTDNPVLIERFVEEAQIGGQLQHPGIVPVYDLGVQPDQRPFFTMKLIEGRTLAALLEERPDPAHELRRFLAIFERICETVAYAHDRRVVHRDLKPANVMVGAFGEVQVVDWGLAKVLDSEASDRRDRAQRGVKTVRSSGDEDSMASVAGSVLGTPHYMPPEQARGEHDKVLPSADVFALGAILLEILTGSSPYAGADSVLMAAADADTAAALERLAGSDAAPELAELCRRCLQRDPTARPADAGALSQAISQYLAEAEKNAQDARIKAAEERRARRFTLILGGVIAVVVAVALGVSQKLRSDREERRARTRAAVDVALAEVAEHRGRAEARRELAPWDRARAALDTAFAAAEGGEVEPELQRRLDELDQELRDGRRRTEAHLEEEQRDQRLIERFAAIRELRDPRLLELSARDRELREIFLEYGYDFENTDLDTLCERIVDSSIAIELSRALDEWARIRRIGVISRQTDPDAAPTDETLLIVAQAADPEELRNELRDAILAGPEALLDYSREVDLEEMPADVLSLLGSWLGLQRAAEFRETCRQVLRRGHQRFPGDFRLTYQLASWESAPPSPDWEVAVPLFRMAHAQQPESLDIRLALVRGLLALRRLEEAAALIDSTLDRAPDHDEAIYLRGAVTVESGDLAGGVADMRRGLEELRIPEGWHRLALSQYLLGDFEAAQEAYRRTLELQRDRTEARLEYAQLLLDHGHTEAGNQQLAEAARFAPTEFRAVAGHAQGLLNARRYPEAARAFRRALQLSPSSEQANIGLSYSLMMSGDLDAAIDEIRRTMKANPGRVEVSVACALSLFYVDSPASALALLQEALEKDPAHPGLRSWAAYVQLFRGDGEEDVDAAFADARAAMDVYDGQDAAQQKQYPYVPAILASCHTLRGEAIHGLRYFERGELPMGSFNSAMFQLIRSIAHHGAGEIALAKRHFHEADDWAQAFVERYGMHEMADVIPEYDRARERAARLLGID